MKSPFRLVGTVTLGSGVLNTFERDHLIAADGSSVRRDRLTHPGAVVVVPVGLDGIWMIRQFRPAVGEWVWELPAGLREPGESAADTAARECIEEIGHEAGSLRWLGRLVTSPGILDERVDVYLGVDLAAVGRRPDDHEERLATVTEVPIEGLRALAADGLLTNSITVAALAMAGYSPRVSARDR